MHLLQKRLEVDLVVLVAGSHREGDWELGVGAAGRVDPVAEDESASASADSGIGVTSSGRLSMALPLKALMCVLLTATTLPIIVPDSSSILVSPLNMLR